MNHKHENLWLLKKCKFILCIFILFNSFHLFIGSKLTLTQSEHKGSKCCHAHFKIALFKIFLLMDAIKILVYCLL